MKILGENNQHYNKSYVCEISETEICQVFNHYSVRDYLGDDNVKIKVGEDIDLGAGYNFRNEIVEACQKMIAAYNAFTKVSDTAIKFAELITNAQNITENHKNVNPA